MELNQDPNSVLESVRRVGDFLNFVIFEITIINRTSVIKNMKLRDSKAL